MNHCRFCNDDLFTDGDSHPCCAWWIGQQDLKRCEACSASKKARRERRERHIRNHVKEKRVDPVCEHCQERESA